MEVMVTTGAIGRAKLQPNCHHQQTNTQYVECIMRTCTGRLSGVCMCVWLCVYTGVSEHRQQIQPFGTSIPWRAAAGRRQRSTSGRVQQSDEPLLSRQCRPVCRRRADRHAEVCCIHLLVKSAVVTTIPLRFTTVQTHSTAIRPRYDHSALWPTCSLLAAALRPK